MTNLSEEEVTFIKFNYTGDTKYICELFLDKFGKKLNKSELNKVVRVAGNRRKGLCTYKINNKNVLFRRIIRGEIPEELYQKLIPYRFNRSDDNGRYERIILVRESYYQWFSSGRELDESYMLFHRNNDESDCSVSNLIPIKRALMKRFTHNWKTYSCLSPETQDLVVKYFEAEQLFKEK